MYKYVEPYPTCDKIIGLFKEVNRRPESDIQIYFENKEEIKYWRSAMKQLQDDNIIKSDSLGSKYYVLTGTGFQLYENGGYKDKLKQLDIQEDFKKQLDNATFQMTDSVTRTNNAVIENIKRNNSIISLTLLVAAISGIGTLGAFILEVYKYNKIPSQQEQNLKPQLNTHLQKLPSRSFAQPRDSLNKKINDTTNKPIPK